MVLLDPILRKCQTVPGFCGTFHNPKIAGNTFSSQFFVREVNDWGHPFHPTENEELIDFRSKLLATSK